MLTLIGWFFIGYLAPMIVLVVRGLALTERPEKDRRNTLIYFSVITFIGALVGLHLAGILAGAGIIIGAIAFYASLLK